MWPAQEETLAAADERVRFLAPFDPIVWDRRRFGWLWGWDYRFEAYTPPAKRKMGYYALPLLWREHIVGWVNVTNKDGVFDMAAGFVEKRPRDAAFKREYDAEAERLRAFLQTGRAPREGREPQPEK